MNRFEEVKSLIDEESAYRRYLGEPKIKGGSLWWRSPFRSEHMASLVYTRGKGLHDFGASKHYDVFSLVQELYRVNLSTALEIVENDFGITTRNPYTNDEIKVKLKARQQYEKQTREDIERKFNELYGQVCDEWKEWEKIRLIFNGRLDCEAYKIALDKTEYLNYLLEEMRLCNDKKKIYERRHEYGL